MTGIPLELRTQMAQIGPIWGQNIQANVATMITAFSNLHRGRATAEVQAWRDLPYGPHQRQKLDVYATDGLLGPAPVLVFVHGGAFVDGTKDRTPEVYSNVCRYFARHGMVAINLEFRLAPEAQFPAGTEDVAAGVEWVRQKIGAYGGDPARIFLMGHSAGATHAGLYAYSLPAPRGIVGLIVMSGRVRCENGAENPNASRVEAYFGVDTERMEQGSLVNHVRPDCVPTMIAIAQYENPLIDVHCVELYHRLSQAWRQAPRFLWLPDHNHASIIAHIGSDEDVLGSQVRDFIHSVVGA